MVGVEPSTLSIRRLLSSGSVEMRIESLFPEMHHSLVPSAFTQDYTRLPPTRRNLAPLKVPSFAWLHSFGRETRARRGRVVIDRGWDRDRLQRHVGIGRRCRRNLRRYGTNLTETDDGVGMPNPSAANSAWWSPTGKVGMRLGGSNHF